MPITKIEVDLQLTSDELQLLHARLKQIVRSEFSGIIVQIADKTDPIQGRDRIIRYPPTIEYSIVLRTSSSRQIEEVLDLLAEFGTVTMQDKRKTANLLSKVAKEANNEAGFLESTSDAMKALKAALGNGGSTWHGLVRRKLHDWFRVNDG
jgi:hypothetical protein